MKERGNSLQSIGADTLQGISVAGSVPLLPTHCSGIEATTFGYVGRRFCQLAVMLMQYCDILAFISIFELIPIGLLNLRIIQ
jgi:hypothetical protein